MPERGTDQIVFYGQDVRRLPTFHLQWRNEFLLETGGLPLHEALQGSGCLVSDTGGIRHHT